jgi:outer membrane protein assembly factor BamB
MVVMVLAIGMAVLLGGAQRIMAENWPHWRGPTWTGSTNETGLPVKFGPAENVKWVAKLPGPSAGTPIIHGDRVFVSSVDTANQDLLAMCLDRTTGKVLWRESAGSGYQPGGAGSRTELDGRSNYASPSPVTDGNIVIFNYGNGDVVCFDMAGKRLWDRNIQKEVGDFSFQWTYSSSCTLFEGKLYYLLLQRNKPVHGRGKDNAESFLMAMDPMTGKTLWKHVRPSNARNESLETFSTPIPFQHEGKWQIIVAGGDVLTGHDPASGSELWRWGTWNPEHREEWWRLVPSAVAGGGAIAIPGPKKAPVFAIKMGLTGTHGDEAVLWKSDSKQMTSDVPTPAYADGSFFVVSDLNNRTVTRVEAATGKVLWHTQIPGFAKTWGSPVVADGKVYFMNLVGTVFVVDAGDGSILHQAEMVENENEIRSTIAISQGNLFIRTNGQLFCIGK